MSTPNPRAKLTPEQVVTVQQMRDDGKTPDEIIKVFPTLNYDNIAHIAPGSFRGKRRQILLYIKNHPGLSYIDFPNNQLEIGYSELARHLQFGRKSGFLTFDERKIISSNGHTSGNPSDKGYFNIRLTKRGEERLSRSNVISNKITGAHDMIAQQLVSTTPNIRLMKPTEIEAIGMGNTPPVEEAPVAAVEAPHATISAEEESYPILDNLRQREAKLHSAMRLLQQASDLFSDAGMTEDGLMLLEKMETKAPTFTSIEKEYLKYADEHKQ